MSNQKIKIGIPDHEGQLSIMFARGGPRAGAGRKAIGETRKISLTLKKEIWDELETLGGAAGFSRSELIRSIIESYLTKN